jgi:hypothetical protein
MNYGIIPLPNLESKFAAADALIDLDKERKEELNLGNEDLKEMRDELMDIRCHKSVRANSWQEKKQLRNDDRELCRKIKEYFLANYAKPDIDKIAENEKRIGRYKTELADLPEIWVDDYQKAIQNDLFGASKPQTLFRKDINSEKRNRISDRIKTLENEIAREKRKGQLTGLEGEIDKITSWDPYDQNTSSPFFDPYWMFGVEKGFDVVIGNPPYVVIKKDEKLKTKYDKIYPYLKSGRVNIYQLFLGCSAHLLTESGVLTFIHPKTLLSDAYLSATRKFILSYFPSFGIVNIVSRTDTFGVVLQSVVVTFVFRLRTNVFCLRTNALRPGTNVLRLRTNVFRPGTNVLWLRINVLWPGTNVFRPGTNVLCLRTNVLWPGTNVFRLRTNALRPGTNVLRLRTNVFRLRTNALRPGTNVLRLRTRVTAKC